MGRKKKKLDKYRIISDFLHGKSSMIFGESVRYDIPITVTKRGLPYVVIIPHEKYEELIDKTKESK